MKKTFQQRAIDAVIKAGKGLSAAEIADVTGLPLAKAASAAKALVKNREGSGQ